MVIVHEVRRYSARARRGVALALGPILVMIGLLSLGAMPASAHFPHTECENVPNSTNDQGRPTVSAEEFVRMLDACEERRGGGGPGGDVGVQNHNGQLTHEAFVTRDGARLWANYSSGSGPSNLIASLPLNTRVGWRYNYDSQYSVVLWYQRDEWGFMHRGSLTCCKNDGNPY